MIYVYTTILNGATVWIRSPDNLWHFPDSDVESGENISVYVQHECLKETGYKVRASLELHHFNEEFFCHKSEEVLSRQCASL